MFCTTKDSTGHTVKGAESRFLTNDLRVISLNTCELRSKYKNLFQVVTAAISVVESDCGSVR